jgi:Zn-dependent protease with chaperone function
VTEFKAIYFDGRTTARVPVTVRGSTQGLQITGPGVGFTVALDDVQVDAQIAGSPRMLDLPGGAQLQTEAHAEIDALFPNANPLQKWVHAFERRWMVALAAVAITAGFSWWSIVYGLPLAAKTAAAAVPLNVESTLGQQTLYTVDKLFCTPSHLDAARQAALHQRFDTLTKGLGDGYRYQLELRDCPSIGANAFALPGGSIVLTDGLVRIAENDEQVTAVLAHEVGHVRYRHGLRMALQATGLTVLISALAGDAVSITGLAATLPTVLLQTSYSREFEDDADTYAFLRLKEIGLSPKYFADIMTRLEQNRDKLAGNGGQAGASSKGGREMDYLSSHPATAKRIARAMANQ